MRVAPGSQRPRSPVAVGILRGAGKLPPAEPAAAGVRRPRQRLHGTPQYRLAGSLRQGRVPAGTEQRQCQVGAAPCVARDLRPLQEMVQQLALEAGGNVLAQQRVQVVLAGDAALQRDAGLQVAQPGRGARVQQLRVDRRCRQCCQQPVATGDRRVHRLQQWRGTDVGVIGSAVDDGLGGQRRRGRHLAGGVAAASRFPGAGAKQQQKQGAGSGPRAALVWVMSHAILDRLAVRRDRLAVIARGHYREATRWWNPRCTLLPRRSAILPTSVPGLSRCCRGCR